MEESFAKFGKASLPRGPKVEKMFKRVLSERGVFARFPTAEMLKLGKGKAKLSLPKGGGVSLMARKKRKKRKKKRKKR